MGSILETLLATPAAGPDEPKKKTPSEENDKAAYVDSLICQFILQPSNLFPLIQLAELMTRMNRPDIASGLADFVIGTNERSNEIRSALIAKFNVARKSKDRNAILAAAERVKANDRTYVSAYHDVAMLHIDARNLGAAKRELDLAQSRQLQHPALDLARSRVDYLETFHYDRISTLRRTLVPDDVLLDAGDVAAEVIAALEQNRPYHFLRLGDGEGVAIGAMLLDDDFALARNQMLMRNLNIWFGSTKPAIEVFIERLREPFLRSIKGADILGIPGVSAMQKTWKNEERGYFGYANVVRLVDQLRRDAPDTFQRMKFASCHANVDLQTGHHLQAIIAKVDRCAIFTCHPQLEGVLKEHFRLKEVQLFRTPSRAASANLFKSAITAPHFPDVYEQILRQIDTIPPGTLCLNAAGFLGKMYAHAAKERGCVIVDIGSVADFWLGYRSRQFTEALSDTDWQARYQL